MDVAVFVVFLSSKNFFHKFLWLCLHTRFWYSFVFNVLQNACSSVQFFALVRWHCPSCENFAWRTPS